MPDAQELARVVCRFERKVVEDPRLSRENNHPTHVERDFARIAQVGDSKSIVYILADEPYQFDRESGNMLTPKEVFPEEWTAFVRANGDGDAIVGMRIEELPSISRTRAADLKARNIPSVEALAALPDNRMKDLGMDGHELREKARRYLDDAKGDSEIEALKAEIAALKAAQTAPIAAPAVEGEGVPMNPAFADWDRESLKAYITDNSGKAPHSRCGDDTLRQMASDIAAKMQAAA